MTIIRALHWLAVLVTGWSLSLRWGDELATGKGPPQQWERHVVGATLLLLIAALAMSFTARASKSAKKQILAGAPSKLALTVSVLCGLASLLVGFALRSAAVERGLPHVLLGQGWLVMLAGASLSLASSSGALLFRIQQAAAADQKKRSKG